MHFLKIDTNNIFLSTNISRLCRYQHNFCILSSLFSNCDLKFNHRAFFVNLNDTYNVGDYVIKVTWWLNKLDMPDEILHPPHGNVLVGTGSWTPFSFFSY